MITQYHVLNGDALKEQFPKDIEGEIIVARECLVEGEVKSDTLEELFQVRANFINTFYGGCTIEEYLNGSASEFKKIKSLPAGSTVNLWFEDDLFCQVNFWFVSFLLQNFVEKPQVFLVRPKVHTPYGFGGLNKAQLKEALADKVKLTELAKLAQLWDAYKNEAIDSLLHTAKTLKATLPFIQTAVEAHIARIPTDTSLGKPTESLLAIMQELGTREFAPVFREFNKRESIYGYGDLQVKHLFDAITKNG